MITSGGTTTLGLYDFKTGIEQFGQTDYWVQKANGYPINKRIMLANGDIVKSTIDGNTNDPNVDMTGWVNTSDKAYVGLSNVDNTSDLAKPVSTATNLAIVVATQDKVSNQEFITTLSLKADTEYVDSAIGAISTDASTQYATLVLANADISNIAINQNVFVSEAANGGYWYKATAGATSLTKSAFDPLQQAKELTAQVTLAALTIPPSAGYPTFNSETKTLNIPAGIIIQYFGNVYTVGVAYSNTFTDEGFYRVYFNTTSNTYRTVEGSGASVNARDYLIAVVRISNTYNHDVTMTCEVVYNGQRANDLTQKFCAITNSAADVVNNLKSYPFYNTASQTLTFFKDTVFSFSNYEYSVTGSDVVISKPSDAGTIWKIFLDITTNTFIAKNYTYNAQFNEKLKWVLVAVIRDPKSYGAKYRVSISMMSDYYVDGKINNYQYVEHVDTTADLIAMPVYDGQKVYVKQWRTESNGRGGGLWEFKADNTDAQNRVDTFISLRTSAGRWKKVIQDNTVTAYDAGLVLSEGLGLTSPVNNSTFWTDFLQTNRMYKCFGLLGELIFDPSAYQNNKVQTIAHRGFYAYHPENTILAFSSAVESGADVLEVDTQLTSDGVFVCYHDATLDTLTNLIGKVDEKTYAEVKLAKFKSLENTRFYDSVGISKLENLLKFARSKGVKVNIECNNYNYTVDTVKSRATVSTLVDLIVAMNMQDQVTISSFTRNDLFYLRTLNKNIRVGLLFNNADTNGTLVTQIKWCAMLGNAVFQCAKDSPAPLLSTINKYVNLIELWTSFKNQDVVQKIEQGFTNIIADVAHGE